MEKERGFTLIDVLIVLVVLGVLVAIIRSQLEAKNYQSIPKTLKTEVTTSFVPAHPEYQQEARMVYGLPGVQWGYDRVQFWTKIDGELVKIHCIPDMGEEIVLIPDPNNNEYPQTSKPIRNPVTWKTWLERLEEVRREAETGLRPGTEEFLRKQDQS